MFVVTRAFRDANGVFGVGSIVDSTSVKAFKSRLQQRHIVDVNATNIDYWSEFFKNRYGIELGGMLGLDEEDTTPEAFAINTLSTASVEESTPEEVEEAQPVVSAW